MSSIVVPRNAARGGAAHGSGVDPHRDVDPAARPRDGDSASISSPRMAARSLQLSQEPFALALGGLLIAACSAPPHRSVQKYANVLLIIAA